MAALIRILSTKKLLSNQKQFLLNAGFSVLENDFIKIEHKSFALDQVNDNLIFTSQNGFLSFLENPQSAGLKNKTVFCVGQKTRQLIQDNGFQVAVYTGYAADLAEIITLIHRNESFTFFSGNLRRDTLPEALHDAGIKFNEIETYETIVMPSKINSVTDGILFYSPSGVESFLKQNKITNQTCFCIGTTTAEALTGITENIVIANQPTIENTIIQCINFYKQT